MHARSLSHTHTHACTYPPYAKLSTEDVYCTVRSFITKTTFLRGNYVQYVKLLLIQIDSGVTYWVERILNTHWFYCGYLNQVAHQVMYSQTCPVSWIWWLLVVVLENILDRQNPVLATPHISGAECFETMQNALHFHWLCELMETPPEIHSTFYNTMKQYLSYYLPATVFIIVITAFTSSAVVCSVHSSTSSDPGSGRSCPPSHK